MLVREVEERGEILDAPRPQMFELVDGESISTWSCGVFAEVNCLLDGCIGEGGGMTFEGEASVHKADETSS